jgi:hypothetical protein
VAEILFASSVTASIHNLGIDTASDRGLEAAATTLWATWRQLISRSEGQGELYDQKLRTMKVGRRLRVVPVGNRSPHIASAPGDPPTRDSGELIGSIKIWQIIAGQRYRVGSTLRKAVWLEYGIGPGYAFRHPAWTTGGLSLGAEGGNVWRGKVAHRKAKDGTRTGPPLHKLVMAPRPHARPALALALPKMQANFVGALRTAEPVVFERIDLLKVRRALLGFSAVIGNLSALGIRFGRLGRLRGAALGLERGLGDFSAAATGNLGLRAARRLTGQQAGRAIADITRGLPAGFATRVGNRFVSTVGTQPLLRRMFK